MTDPTGVCPVCGSHSTPLATHASSLLAVCDVLVIRALESVGKRIVRVDRSRFGRLDGRPWHLAHTLWQPDPGMVDKCLASAWDVVPAVLATYGCCGISPAEVVAMLDRYCRDLLLTNTGHSTDELRYRFEAILGLPLADPREVQQDAC